jgi:4-amino-4-deoxy-L-arabinose transferase-like glycosyltransferase
VSDPQARRKPGVLSRIDPAGSRWRLAGFLAALFVLALLVRLPGLLMIPRFEDEGEGVLWALDIFEGDHLPVRAVKAYTGPLFAYLVAGLFYLFGPDILWPRLLVAVFGALTVPATFLLGRAVADARVGLIAAVFALTNPALVLMSSRYGWSNSLTPFFATATLTAIYLGVSRRRGSLLAVGGVLAGLTLQTHAASVFLLAGIVVWVLLTHSPKEWITGRHLGAVFGFVVGYAPMLWNFAAEWGTFARQVGEQDYAFGVVDSVLSYGERLGVVLLALLVTSLGAPWAALAAIGGRVFRRRGPDIRTAEPSPTHRLAAVVWFVWLASFPFFVATPIPRYFLLLLPLMFVWMASTLDRHASTTPSSPSLFHSASARRTALALAFFVVIDLAVIAGTHGYFEYNGLTNAPFFELRSTLANGGACSEGVFVEDREFGTASDYRMAAAYFNLRTIRYLLIMDGCLASMAPAPNLSAQLATRDAGAWLVLSTHSVPVFAEQLHLVRIMGIVPGPLPPEPLRYALYRATPR